MILGKRVKGYTMGVVAAATYGLNPLFALPLYANGMDANSTLLLRYLTGLPIVAIIAWLSGDGLSIKRHEILPLAAVGMLMGYSSLALFESYNCMEASIASTMLFVYPLMVAVIMSIFFREKFTWITGTCLLIASLGLIMLYNGKPGATLNPTGVMWVMTSALSYALVLIAINRSQLASIPSNRLTFYLLLFGIFIFAGRSTWTTEITLPSDNILWLNIFALGLLPTAVSLICTAISIHNIGSTPTALLGVFEPVTAVLCGVIVFGEHLTTRDTGGLILIMISVMMVIAGGLRRHSSTNG